MPPPIIHRPLQMRIGTDICQISRIKNILTSKSAPRFLRRVLTPEELEFNPKPKLARALAEALKPDSHSKMSSPDVTILSNFVAGRFAAKEAVIKAHPYRALSFADITIKAQMLVTKNPGGVVRREAAEDEAVANRSWPPVAIIRSNPALDTPDCHVPISISHDGDYATATCIAADEGTAQVVAPKTSTHIVADLLELNIQQAQLRLAWLLRRKPSVNIAANAPWRYEPHLIEIHTLADYIELAEQEVSEIRRRNGRHVDKKPNSLSEPEREYRVNRLQALQARVQGFERMKRGAQRRLAAELEITHLKVELQKCQRIFKLVPDVEARWDYERAQKVILRKSAHLPGQENQEPAAGEAARVISDASKTPNDGEAPREQ